MKAFVVIVSFILVSFSGPTRTDKSYGNVGKAERAWLPNRCYCRSHRLINKYVIFTVYLAIAVAIVVFLYLIRISNMALLSNIRESNSRQNNIDSLNVMQDRERASYNLLMHYILHPEPLCITSKVLGGKPWKNKKLDGDKVICLEPGPGIREECIVYSFGIDNDWSFDEGMQREFGCNVYSFDPSMKMDDHLHSKGVWFYNLGIGKFDGEVTVGGRVWKIKTFDSILQQLGHKNRTIDILKIDIEGAEYDVLEDMLKKRLLKHVNQLCFEIHLNTFPHWTQILKMLRRIEKEAGLRLFSTRNNTQTPMEPVAGFSGRREQMYFELAWFRP